MEKIGVFGGTFNPPHNGHVLAANEARQALNLKEILFIPDSIPPHKELTPNSPTPEMRLQLTRAAVEGFPWAKVSDMEIKRKGKSYTADTLKDLRQLYPEADLYLLTGTDMFLTLDEWYHPEEICQYAVIVGMYRSDLTVPEDMKRQKEKLEKKYHANVVLLENSYIDISSTDVRRLLILGGADAYLPKQEYSIILREKLYGAGYNYKNLDDEGLAEVALGLLKKKRVPHVQGCAETARKLAVRWNEDEEKAYRAGLLHDVTKALEGRDQLLLVDRYGIMISNFERKNYKLLHAKTGAAVAKEVFGECDDISEAIRWHTTGKPAMKQLEKILYLADYMEPTRNFPGVEKLRALAFENLDEALLLGLNMSMEELVREGKSVCEDSISARDYLLENRGRQ